MTTAEQVVRCARETGQELDPFSVAFTLQVVGKLSSSLNNPFAPEPRGTLLPGGERWAPWDPTAVRFEGPDVASLVHPKIELVASGFRWTEGPTWLHSHGGGLLISDTIDARIYLIKPSGKVEILATDSGGYDGSNCNDFAERFEPGSNGETTRMQFRFTITVARTNMWPISFVNRQHANNSPHYTHVADSCPALTDLNYFRHTNTGYYICYHHVNQVPMCPNRVRTSPLEIYDERFFKTQACACTAIRCTYASTPRTGSLASGLGPCLERAAVGSASCHSRF